MHSGVTLLKKTMMRMHADIEDSSRKVITVIEKIEGAEEGDEIRGELFFGKDNG